MLRRVLLLAACLTAPMLAAPGEPSPAQIRRAAETCTAQGAFGIGFSEKFSQRTTKPAAPEWTPFQVLFIQPNVKSGQVSEIDATASFAKALMSNEDRIALARWVFRSLDSAIQARQVFVIREQHANRVRYHAESGYTLDLSHDGTTVRMNCTGGRRAPDQ